MSLSAKHLTTIFIAILVLFISVTVSAREKPEKGDELKTVIARLVKDGFDKQKIDALFAKKEIFFTTKGVSIFFSYFESAPNYHQFLEKKSIDKAIKYAAENKGTLEQAEKIYVIDKTVITAILLVETRLGTYLGKYTTINMLASIAALEDEALKERIWNDIPKKAKPKRQKFNSKVEKRKKWGYNELKAFIKYTDRENIAPETVKGSFAGAIGICQFMPSNALKIARDGNSDGKVDLFSHQDAIFSIANYLKHHGWKPNLSRQQQYDVIYTYNHSNYYVDTIQKVSDKLKEK
ncbi:MAG: lytic murein transglycosylase [Desulfobacula sp.]|nr:lytic murein transglycosylase [Desulfobacula sp.]